MAAPITTLSDLYSQDVPQGSILIPQYPTSCDAYSDGDPLNNFFVNDTQLNLFDHFKVPNGRTYKELIPHRIMAVTGPYLKVYADREPSPALSRHWLDKLGPKVATNWGQPGGDKPHIVIFPLDRLRPELHSVDPFKHYHVFSKFFIPEINCPQARVLKTPEYPCVIKCAYGAASEGTFMAYNDADYHDIKALFREKEPGAKAIITEMVEDVVGNYCCQFYLTRKGEIQWLGVTEQMMDDEGIWLGASVRSACQKKLEELLKPTLVPVAQKLWQWDYFGIVGVDILVNKDGEQFVIDINPRINGSTPMLLVSKAMAKKGWKDGVFVTEMEFSGSEQELIQATKNIKTGEIVIFSVAEQKDHTVAHVGVFSTNLTNCRKIILQTFRNLNDK